MLHEALLNLAFFHNEIKPKHRENILSYLRILYNRDEATFHHSIRVGLLAESIALIAKCPGITPKMLLWAGLLHDIGKILIHPDLLSKTKEFSDEDYEAMKVHPQHGWDMLNKIHDYTAAIIVRHHTFGQNPYPCVLPPLPAYLIDREPLITKAARLLALADYYDALMNRQNDKHGGQPQNAQEKQEKYIHDNQDQAELVEKLVSLGVLSFS
jgi:putative nucleotidyltransferase with HDIG domain